MSLGTGREAELMECARSTSCCQAAQYLKIYSESYRSASRNVFPNMHVLLLLLHVVAGPRVVQVSEHASWCIGFYARIMEAALAAAGAPAGLVSFVMGYGDAGHALVTGGVDKVGAGLAADCNKVREDADCKIFVCLVDIDSVWGTRAGLFGAGDWRGPTTITQGSLDGVSSWGIFCAAAGTAACAPPPTLLSGCVCGQHRGGQEGHGGSSRPADTRDPGAGGQGRLHRV